MPLRLVKVTADFLKAAGDFAAPLARLIVFIGGAFAGIYIGIVVFLAPIFAWEDRGSGGWGWFLPVLLYFILSITIAPKIFNLGEKLGKQTVH
jgi:hypothetical protein